MKLKNLMAKGFLLILLLSRIISDEAGWGFSFGSDAGGSSTGGSSSGTDMTGAGVMALSSILGSVLGKNKTQVVDDYPELRKQVSSYLGGKLGTSTPYTQNSAFDLAKPEVESAAEKSILGYFNNPKSNVADYSAATKKYSDASKESMAASYADEMNKTKDMYNRLGLVSSTPGLTAQGDVAESQRVASNLFDSELMYKNLDRELQAMGLDANQLNSMLSQSSVLGQGQTARQQYSQKMSMQDIQNQIAEMQGYSGQATGLVGGNPSTQIQTPNIWSNLGQTGTDIGSLMLQNSILGNNSSISSGIKDIGGGNTTNSAYKLVNGKLTYVG